MLLLLIFVVVVFILIVLSEEVTFCFEPVKDNSTERLDKELRQD